MKKPLYTFLFVLVLSCANETKNKSAEIFTEEAIEMPINEETPVPEKSSFENLASQKLVDYFDLLRLQQEYPEFTEDIQLQLKKYTLDSTFHKNYQHIKSIENIRQIGDIVQVSDSVRQIKLHFDLLIDKTTITDSILAKILFKKIIIENSSTKSYKVQFQNLN